jgi:hypothetical protein
MLQLYDFFARLMIENPTEPRERDLIFFMIANADNLFSGEYLDSFKKTAQDTVSELQIKKVLIFLSIIFQEAFIEMFFKKCIFCVYRCH